MVSYVAEMDVFIFDTNSGGHVSEAYLGCLAESFCSARSSPKGTVSISISVGPLGL